MAIGIVCAALIFLWVEYQYAYYNRQLPGADNTYIFKNNQYYGEDIETTSATNGSMTKAVYNEIPGFQAIARTLDAGGVFSFGDKYISQAGIYADSSFFHIYKFPITAKQPYFRWQILYKLLFLQKWQRRFSMRKMLWVKQFHLIRVTVSPLAWCTIFPPTIWA